MQKIETYPREQDKSTGAWWGPEAIVVMQTEYGPVLLVAHLEAGEWLARDAGDPIAWGPLATPPTHWMPAPDLANT